MDKTQSVENQLNELIRVSFKETVRDNVLFHGYHYYVFNVIRARNIKDFALYILEPTTGVLIAMPLERENPYLLTKPFIQQFLHACLRRNIATIINSPKRKKTLNMSLQPIRDQGKECKLISVEKINKNTFVSYFDWYLIIKPKGV